MLLQRPASSQLHVLYICSSTHHLLALSAIADAISRFQVAGKPWLRPPDYIVTQIVVALFPVTPYVYVLQALSATVEAIGRFQAAGKPWLRPPDYYAEMVKSDEQMARIKDRLMYEQQQIDQAAER
jgi:hypothetical protein